MPVLELSLLSLTIISFIAIGGIYMMRRNAAPKAVEILVVDDAPAIRHMMCEILKDMGWRPDAALDGREALRMLDHKKYDLIFMDCHMPVLDGFKATQAIREYPGNTDKKPIIVALTGDNTDHDREVCLKSGMNDFVPKPFVIEQVEDVVRKWVA